MMTPDTSSKQNGWKETPQGSLIECRFRGRNISEQEKSRNEKHVPSILHLSENSNLFVRPQMFAFSYRFDQGRVKHEGHTINPEIAPTAELLKAQTFKLHASDCSCVLLEAVGRRNERPALVDTFVQPRFCILQNLHNFIVALASCNVQWSRA